MLRIISFTLFYTVALLSTSAYSMENHALMTGVTVEYDLPPNDPQLFTNYMFWPVEANCIMTSEDESNVLFIEALAKRGKINDITLAKGESLRILVHSGESVKINADSGAKVSITNEGQHIVKASCTA